jgi:hypothetical protein
MVLIKYDEDTNRMVFDEKVGSALVQQITKHVFNQYSRTNGTGSAILYSMYNDYVKLERMADKKPQFESELLAHYRQVIQTRTDFINAEIQQFGQEPGAFNEYLSYVMTLVNTDLGHVVRPDQNMYDVMHRMVENAKKIYINDKVSDIDQQIQGLQALLVPRKKRNREDLSIEEIHDQINTLKHKKRLFESGIFVHSPPRHTIQNKPHSRTPIATGKNLSGEYGGRRTKRRRQKTKRRKSIKH